MSLKIAIASSGLGRVFRGIETWATDTAQALHANGMDVTLFAGRTGERGKVSGVRCQGEEVGGKGEGGRQPTTDNRQPTTDHRQPTTDIQPFPLPILHRGGRAARWLARMAPGFTWRWGLKSPYGWEQWTMWLALRRHLTRGDYDILHVQDPMLAYWCRRARERGRVRTQEILAHGTEESAAFRAGFPCLQELAPWHLAELRHTLGLRAEDRPLWTALPNFVDTETFRPAGAEERMSVRAHWGIPSDALVVGCVAAVKRSHKRVDHLIAEFARLATGQGQRRAFLLVAGARTAESAEIAAQAERLAAGQVRLCLDVSREDMPGLYRAMDVCVLPSLFEMMPIAVLEAMASGVPMLVNHHPVLRWMIGAPDSTGEGPGGVAIDMAAAGTLAGALEARTPTAWQAQGEKARQHAVAVFSRETVVGQYVRYYRRIPGENSGPRIPGQARNSP